MPRLLNSAGRWGPTPGKRPQPSARAFLSTNPALQLCEPEGLAGVGLENPLADPVCEDLVETVKTSSEPEMAHQRASEWLRTTRIAHEVGLYSELVGAEVEPHSVEPKLAAMFAADVEGYSG
jgi:hypothetical protein